MNVKQDYISLGADPELFLRKNKKIIGSEKIIPEEGLSNNKVRPWWKRVVRDGVQVELHPLPYCSVVQAISGIAEALTLISEHAKKKDVSLVFDGSVTLTPSEFKSLSKESRVLGCVPSLNIYGPRTVGAPKNFMTRSGGGHIHLGFSSSYLALCQSMKNNGDWGEDLRHRLIPLLDIFVGNTCVLLDRDPDAANRRKYYGRAGEYRLTSYGLEYRTPSNFWLKSPILYEFVIGLCYMAIGTLEISFSSDVDLEQKLVDVVNIDNFIKAIDTNDRGLALENLGTIRPLIREHGAGSVLADPHLDKVIELSGLIDREGVESIWPEAGIVESWTKTYETKYATFLEKL